MSLPPSPRVFLIRHGETDWVLGGKHNGRTEVPLSKAGEEDVKASRDMLVGQGKMIDPLNVSNVYCSPRVNTRRTAEIIGLKTHSNQYFYDRDTESFIDDSKVKKKENSVQVTTLLQEWDYGEYEGMTLAEIERTRKQHGQNEGGRAWDIWEEGCPGGEKPQDISDRLDKLIAEIRSIIKSESSVWPNGQIASSAGSQVAAPDFVCIAHDHILAALVLRWTRQPLSTGHMRVLIKPGGVVVLGFEHDNIEEPAVLVGLNPGRAMGAT